MPIDLELLNSVRLRCVDTESGCWEWQGSTTTDGAPRMWHQGHNVLVTRVVRPGVDRVYRQCGNQLCVNPHHLGTAPRRRQLTLEQIRARCAVDDECWIWQQATNGFGLPTMQHDGRTRSGRRLAWSLAGNRGNGRLVMTCGEKRCLNPAHMKLLSFQQFAAERAKFVNRVALSIASRRSKRAQSALAPHITEIRRRIAAGETNVSIARDMGVTHGTISRIRVGKSWRESSPWTV